MDLINNYYNNKDNKALIDNNKILTLVTILVTALSLLIATFYFIKRWYYRGYYISGLPPLIKVSPLALVEMFKDASYINEYYKQYNLLGSLFCIELPFFRSPVIMCSDITLAKLILSGSDKYEEADKELGFYDAVLKLCKGPNMIAISSKNPKVHAIRKGLSQSFSTISLNKNFKSYNTTLATFMNILTTTAQTHTSVDITTLLTAFTFDFLTSSLLQQNFNALGGEGTEVSNIYM